MHVVVSVLVVVAVLVIGVGLVSFLGNRMVRDSGEQGSSAGVGNAFGGFDVFDPSKARAKEDLESEKHQTTVTPSSGDDDRAVRFDIDSGVARVRRTPRPPVDVPGSAAGGPDTDVPEGPADSDAATD